MSIYLTALLAILNQVAVKGSKMLVALYAIELGASPLAIGALVSTYAVFPLVLAVYAGRVSDRRGVRGPMILGSLGMAAGLVLPVVFPALPALFLSSALIGTASLFFHVSVHNLVGSLGEGLERTRNFGTFSLAASMSGLMGPLLVGFAIDHSGYLPTYLLLAAVACIPSVALACYSGFIPARVKALKEKHGGSVKDLLGSPSLRRTFFTSGLIITGIDLFNFYMPIYGRSIDLSASVIGTILGMQAAAAFVVRLWMPRLSKRFGERRVLTASLVVAGVTYLAFPGFENPYVLGLISFVLGLGLGCGQPLSIILTYNDSPPGRAGEALGLRLTVNKFTQIVVPIAFGSLGTAAGMHPVFWMNALLLLTGGYLSSEKRR
jgi:MFS family permease